MIVIGLVVAPSVKAVVVVPKNFKAELNPKSAAVISFASDPLKDLLPKVKDALVLSAELAVAALSALPAVAALPE